MGNFNKEKITRLFISLFISLFIWGYVTNMYNPIQTKTISNVPITVNNLDALLSQNLALDSSSTSAVNVVVEGRYSDIQNLTTKDVSVTADLNDLALKEGTNNIVLNITSLNNKIQIVEKKTSLQAKIEVVKLLQKEIPVMVVLSGELDKNYVSGEPVLAKDKVICTGTKDSLNDVKYAVATVDITNAKNSIDSKFELKVLNKVGDEVSNVNLKDKEITVNVPIKFAKDVPVKIIFKNSLPYGYKIENQTIDKTSITIIGEKSIVDTIKYIETEPLDLSRRYYDFDKRLSLVFPEGISSKSNTNFVYSSFEITKK